MSAARWRNTTPVLGLPVMAANPALALDWLAEDLQERRKGYVCFVSVHGVVQAQRNAALAESYANAAMRLPDGAPVVWVGRRQGESDMSRVAGPELMLDVLADSRFCNATHFLYGGEPGVAPLLKQRLEQRFPHARIVGTHTPPFRDLNAEEEDALIEQVRELKPDFFWVGVGCPRQEVFMHRYAELLEATILCGVGAAFDFHTDRIKDSPEWVKRAGLQWLHRLVQDPRRLWKRYLQNNSAFVWMLMLEALGLQQPRPIRTVQSMRPAPMKDRAQCISPNIAETHAVPRAASR